LKCLIFSDVHRHKKRFLGILREHSDATYILSLGDSEFSHSYLKEKNVIGVKGNYPMDGGLGYDYTLTTGGKTLFITHGHKYSVKYGYDKLYYKMQEEQADFCFHGHTHQISFEDVGKGYIINPGAVNHPRGSYPASYLVMFIEETVTFKWYDAENHTLLKEISV